MSIVTRITASMEYVNYFSPGAQWVIGQESVVFAAFKFIATFIVACISVIAAIVESGHPWLLGCACAAFGVGALSAEAVRVYRSNTVRSDIR